MSPRRSPRLKGPSPKPELPQKPRPPKRVNDVAADSVRVANYQAGLAAWEAAKLEHAKLMKIRKGKQMAAGRAAVKSAAEAEAPPPAAPPAVLAPPPQLSADEARLVGLPALAEGRELAAVERPAVQQQDERFPRLRRQLGAVGARCRGDRFTLRSWRS